MFNTYNPAVLSSIKNVMSGKKVEPTQINEKLEPHEEDEVENWGAHFDRPEKVENELHRVFGHRDRIEEPLNTAEETPHPDVESHLNKHGFHITDYVGGKAKDKYNRETNIGKALTKTNAEPSVKAAYDNDPIRQQRKAPMKVVISHHPYDVAGMTSKGQPWENQSCMNFKDGCYNDSLPHEIRQGTHVAYLTDQDDEHLDRPQARIAVKPYYGDDTGHLIFRPERKTYGNAGSAFESHVNGWFEKHYPANEGETYTKNDKVYNDTGDTYHAPAKEDLEDDIDSRRKIIHDMPSHLISHVTNYVLQKHESNPTGNVLNNFAAGKHNITFNRNQANALYSAAKDSGQREMTWHIAQKHGHMLNKENIEHAGEFTQTQSVIGHRYLPQKAVDGLSPSMLEYVHPANIKPHHMDKVVNSYLKSESGSSYPLRALSKHLSTDHLTTLADNLKSHTTSQDVPMIINHPNATPELINKVWNNVRGTTAKDAFLRTFKHPTAEHVATATSTNQLNAIMANTSDKITHNLALHKAIGIEKDRYKDAAPYAMRHRAIHLHKNSAQFIGDAEIPHIYDNLHHFSVGDADSSIHEKLINHAMTQAHAASQHLAKVQDAGHTEWDDPIHDHAQYEMGKHFDTHADLIDEKLSVMKDDHINSEPIDGKYFTKLKDHIHTAKNHPAYNDSHYEVSIKHNDLYNQIDNGRW